MNVKRGLFLWFLIGLDLLFLVFAGLAWVAIMSGQAGSGLLLVSWVVFFCSVGFVLFPIFKGVFQNLLKSGVLRGLLLGIYCCFFVFVVVVGRRILI